MRRRPLTLMLGALLLVPGVLTLSGCGGDSPAEVLRKQEDVAKRAAQDAYRACVDLDRAEQAVADQTGEPRIQPPLDCGDRP